jgi:glycosyltransferase involved in cell wall biosynthesis
VSSKTILFTNFFTPYRAALWRPLSELVPLEVRLASAGDAGRGWDTNKSLDSSVAVKFCNLRSFNWPTNEFWFPNDIWSDLTEVSAVVLGGWETPAYWHVAWKAKHAGIRTVGFYESTAQTQAFTSGLIAKFRTKYFLSLDAVVTPGSGATEALLNMGVDSRKIFQGFNVVDHLYWHTNANKAREEETEQLGHSYLYVGRLIESKGISDLIMAFKKCAQPHDTLKIVGNGPQCSYLQALIASLNLQDIVMLVGAKSGLDLANEYSRAQTLVLVSRKEVWGLVVNEALASGLHVVVTAGSFLMSEIWMGFL